MKRTFFLLAFVPSIAFAKQIVLNIPDTEIAVVENEALSSEKWIRDAWAGKVYMARQHIIQAEIQRCLNEKTTIPAGDDAIIKQFLSRSDYESRAQREADQQSQ